MSESDDFTDANNLTIKAYEGHVQEYVAGNHLQTEGILKEWINQFLKLVSKSGLILELGSAYGRDADYMESLGYKVIRTDAVQNFVDLMQQQGHKAKLLNAITDDLGGGYDAVYANAVFLHFSRDQFSCVLLKVFQSLKVGGILAFSVKKGIGEGWSKHTLGVPRYFNYWQMDDLTELVKNRGFTVLNVSERKTKSDWLHVIAQK